LRCNAVCLRVRDGPQLPLFDRIVTVRMAPSRETHHSIAKKVRFLCMECIQRMEGFRFFKSCCIFTPMNIQIHSTGEKGPSTATRPEGPATMVANQAISAAPTPGPGSRSAGFIPQDAATCWRPRTLRDASGKFVCVCLVHGATRLSAGFTKLLRSFSHFLPVSFPSHALNPLYSH